MTPVILSAGATGDQVTQLQLALSSAGYDPGGVDGIYGAGTEAAVRRFQGDRGLAVDGIAGPGTLAALAAGGLGGGMLRQGSSGNQVRQLQQALGSAGYDPAGIDGIYGAGTEAAVRRFQGDHGLDVDGIVGDRTWQAVMAAAGSGQPSSPRGEESPPPGPGGSAQGGLSAQGAEFIARFEGCRLQLYNDPVGHCTIGVGHLVHHGPCNGSEGAEFIAGITRDRAFEILRTDAASAARAVLGAVSVPLNQAELDALISFVFNVGAGAFQTSTLLKRLNDADRGAVPGELGRWTKASGQDLPGLVIRRAAEGHLFAGGGYG